MARLASSVSIPPSDRAEVEDLLCEFAARVDDGRAETVHELFVESGRIETPRFVLANREQVREHFTARGKDRSRRTRHYWSNARFSGSDGEIGVVTNVMTIVTTDSGGAMIMAGTSTDVVVRHEDGWAFRSRHLDVTFEGALAPMGANP